MDPTTGPLAVPGPPADDPIAAEAGLVARLKAGDGAAYEHVLRDYGGRLLATARRIMPSDDDAQDAFQDAMLSAFKAIARFDGQSRLSTWLHRIVVNACLMKLRSKRRRPEKSIDHHLPTFDDTGHQSPSSRPWKPAGTNGIETEEARRMVRQAVEQLPDSYRVVLMLRDVEGLDTLEVALLLEMSESAVKTRLHRARQALKELLDPHMRDDSTPSGSGERNTP